MSQASIAALRKFVRTRESEERCDICGSDLQDEHTHSFDPVTRRIRCACESCAELYAPVYKRIPNRVIALRKFEMGDAQWDELSIPISLAFFSYSTHAQKWVALYPGPAGAAESLLPIESWQEVMAANPALDALQADVEALLVNRIGENREYFVVPIDACYKLVGLIRLHWRGLSGGALVWGEIARFFEGLRRKADPCRA